MSKNHEPYISISSGMRGYFAIHIWWNPDMGGFWEPVQTGIGSYKTAEEAIPEAKMWAEDEEIRYVAPGETP